VGRKAPAALAVTDADPGVGAPRGRRVALAVAFVALGVGLFAVLGRMGRDEVLAHFHVGYRRQVEALLAKGQFVAALEELERASLIDRERLGMLDRMTRLNRAAGVRSPPIAQLARSRAEDAELRFRIGRGLLAKLGAGGLSAEERDTLERATENARVLVALEPDSARAHYLLGSVHLLRWRVDGAARELAEASAHLERAISIEPTHPGALRALHAVQQAGRPKT